LAEDTRHCPRHLPIAVTLFGIMRSIASSDRKAIKRRADLAVVPTNESLTTVSYGGVDPRQSPEDRIILEEAAAGLKAGILKLFDDDAIAQLLVEGMIDEMEGKELRNLLGLNEKDFASKRRLVRRRIDKAKLNGWKS
jgi:hypothetical protein